MLCECQVHDPKIFPNHFHRNSHRYFLKNSDSTEVPVRLPHAKLTSTGGTVVQASKF